MNRALFMHQPSHLKAVRSAFFMENMRALGLINNLKKTAWKKLALVELYIFAKTTQKWFLGCLGKSLQENNLCVSRSL